METREWDDKMGLVRAQAYCAGAEHCCSEVRSMLERHNVPAAGIDGILESLQKDGFINESRYAEAFVSDKLRFAHWGRRKIGLALKMKRIDQALVAEALEGIDMETYLEVMKQVVKSCYRQAKAPTQYARNMKTLKSVASRGFEPELARKFLAGGNDCDTSDTIDDVL
ncbi:MAG: RecX family transcriptional regulator [Bacteroidaceae bacterium]|nr:RecX family transcriptional regulator [Bacteroidaceae bacterium]